MDQAKLSKLYFAPFFWLKRRSIRKYQLYLMKRFCKQGNVLTKQQIKELRKFYSPYCKVSPEFHSYYQEKTGVFSEKYLPTDIYINYIDEYYNSRYGAKYMDNKCYYPKMFAGIPQADTIAFRVNNLWVDKEDHLLSTEALATLLDNEPSLFVKYATTSAGGKGVYYLENSTGSLVEQLLNVVEKTSSDIVVQRPLKQHAALAAINESSVNTIRVLSLLSQDGVTIYSSVLRMGIGNAKVDNASSGGVTCGINPDGTLKKIAYKPSGESYECHPTSNIPFEGYVIPGIHQVWETVQRAHPMVPHFRLVSWDFAIDENGHPVMIEANLNLGELDFHQLNNGPVFGDDTKKILDEVFGKK